VHSEGDILGALQGAKGCLLGLHSALLGDSTLASDCFVGDITLLCSDIVPGTAGGAPTAAVAGLLLVAGSLPAVCSVVGLPFSTPSLCWRTGQLLARRAGSKESALVDGVDVNRCQAVGGDSSR
jgi:hypothetical protein